MQYFREIIFLLDDDRLKIPWLVLLFIFTSMFDLAGIGLVGPYVSAVVDPENFLNSSVGNTLIMLGLPTGIKDILFIMSSDI